MLMDETRANQASPVLFRKKASWDDISLEYFRFRDGEVPEHSHRQHLVTFSLGARCKGEIRTASGFRARAETDNSVCVIPSGRPFTAQLVGESEQLAIFLEPSLVLRAASEARASRRNVEIREVCAPDDPVIRNVGLALYGELESEGLGGRLYAESLANILAVHLLRHYTASRN